MGLAEYLTQCSNIRTIKDINDQYSYEDTNAGGDNDGPLVSCGQQGSYNELKYIYDTKLIEHVESGGISEENALKALCETCQELSSPRTRVDFYQKLSQKLNITIS